MEEWCLVKRQRYSTPSTWYHQFTGKRSSFICQLKKRTLDLSCSGLPELNLPNTETIQIDAQTPWHWSLFFFFQMYVGLLKIIIIIKYFDYSPKIYMYVICFQKES